MQRTAYCIRKLKSEVGDHRSVGIPGNIPNPAVKRVSADGTWRAASWESKKLPTSLFCLSLFKSEVRSCGRCVRAVFYLIRSCAASGAGIRHTVSRYLFVDKTVRVI